MFGVFDDNLFPLIKITLNNIVDNNDFVSFCNNFESYDSRKQKYTFVIDTTNVGYVPIKYAYLMAIFIKKLKNRKKTMNNVYLDRSIIVCNNIYIRRLLEVIFSLQSPISNVYIVDSYDKVENLYNNLQTSIHFYESDVSVYFSENQVKK